MSRAVDLGRVRVALAALDGLVARYPWLKGARAKVRLGTALDANDGGSDVGHTTHGNEEEDIRR
jgi:hypothetical protein